MATDKKAIHPDIPTDIAWQVGRRLYVRTSSRSQLGDWMYQNNANWDKTMSPWGRWVGSTKRDILVPEVLAHMERIAHVKDVVARGYSVAIPFDEEDMRADAKQLGAVFDGESKRWFLPTYEDMENIRRRLGAPLWGLVDGTPDRSAPLRRPEKLEDGRYVYPGEAGYDEAADHRRAIEEAKYAASVFIPYEARDADDLARSLGAKFDRATRRFVMSEEAAVQVRAAVDEWYDEQAELKRQKVMQKRRDLVVESGRTPIEEADEKYWDRDDLGPEGAVVIENGCVYVIVEVQEEDDGEHDYIPATTRGIQVEPTADDQAEIDRRTEIAAIATERRRLQDQIRQQGEYPEGLNHVAADALMSTRTIYGAGEWFAVTDTHVWYVLNNGMDGDDWSRNNVATGGAGAIGWRVDRGTADGRELAEQVLDLVRRDEITPTPRPIYIDDGPHYYS